MSESNIISFVYLYYLLAPSKIYKIHLLAVKKCYVLTRLKLGNMVLASSPASLPKSCSVWLCWLSFVQAIWMVSRGRGMAVNKPGHVYGQIK